MLRLSLFSVVIFALAFNSNQFLSGNSIAKAAAPATPLAPTTINSTSPVPTATRKYRVLPLAVNYMDSKMVNDQGMVLAEGRGQNWESWQALKFVNGQLTRTDLPIWPRDLNNKGQVVGDRDHHAYLWENGKLTDLGTLGQAQSLATSINESGQIVGVLADGHRPTGGFLWTNGKITNLGAFVPSSINDKGQIVGEKLPGPKLHVPVLWQDGKLVELGALLGSGSGQNLRINNRGQITGISWPTSDNKSHCFMWESGKTQDIGLLPGKAGYCQTEDINDSGQIVGIWFPDRGSKFGFVWQDGVLTDLNRLSLDTNERWEFLAALGINNRGEILAECESASVEANFCLLTPNVAQQP